MFQRLDREEVFSSHWLKLFLDTVTDDRNVTLKYNVVHVRRESVVVMVRKGDQLLLTENYRYPIEKVQLEFPAGEIEKGETPFQAAEREVYEETGVRIQCQPATFSFYPSNGLSDQRIHIVFGEYMDGELNPQYEIMKCFWMDEKEWKGRLALGEITDAASLIAYLYSLLF
ncbi:MAG: NUDIX hydrolase [Lachnospiraceae bacterium]|nr:NUDIX hydrolase [Lachnospiraceae bacterium]